MPQPPVVAVVTGAGHAFIAGAIAEEAGRSVFVEVQAAGCQPCRSGFFDVAYLLIKLREVSLILSVGPLLLSVLRRSPVA
jgi:hypothetical protein